MEIKGGYYTPLYRNEKIRTKNINIKLVNLQVKIFQTKKINSISLFVTELLQLKDTLNIRLTDLADLFTFMFITLGDL